MRRDTWAWDCHIADPRDAGERARGSRATRRLMKDRLDQGRGIAALRRSAVLRQLWMDCTNGLLRAALHLRFRFGTAPLQPRCNTQRGDRFHVHARPVDAPDDRLDTHREPSADEGSEFAVGRL